jgi:hypothetical protein
MPERLRNARIDRNAWAAAMHIVRKFHRISFPLYFWQDTGHSTDVAAMQRLVDQTCKVDVPDVRTPVATATGVACLLPAGTCRRAARRRSVSAPCVWLHRTLPHASSCMLRLACGACSPFSHTSCTGLLSYRTQAPYCAHACCCTRVPRHAHIERCTRGWLCPAVLEARLCPAALPGSARLRARLHARLHARLCTRGSMRGSIHLFMASSTSPWLHAQPCTAAALHAGGNTDLVCAACRW